MTDFELFELFNKKIMDDYNVIEFKSKTSPISLVDIQTLIVLTNYNVIKNNFENISKLNKIKIFHLKNIDEIIWSKEKLNNSSIIVFYDN